MTATGEHTAGCWRPDATVHCCGLRNPDGSWRVPGLKSAAAVNSRDQMFWNAALIGAQVEAENLRAQLAELLPYAYAGAEALDFREPPYGPPDPDETFCDGAAAMLARIKAGEFAGGVS